MQCSFCEKCFSKKFNLNRHLRNVHNQQINNKVTIQCPLCPILFKNTDQLNCHIEIDHEVQIEKEVLSFQSDEEFLIWKTQEENVKISKFVQHRGAENRNSGDWITTTYYCHRSGNFIPSGMGHHHLKVLGSNKMNAECPAKIITKRFKDDHIEVKYIKTHVGHEMELGRIRLNESERKLIAMKLSQNVPMQTILDEVRNSYLNELERIHLLTRQDITNIAKSFNLKKDYMYHTNDAVSVDMWVKKVSGPDSPVICYKPQGETIEGTTLDKDDFLLVLMNSAQSEVFQKFGNNIVCMDSTHGTNAYNFLLTTILILDDKCEGFPVCFIISNKQDHITLHYALTKVKEHGLQVEVKVFMSDIDNAFFNAWNKTFKSPEFRLWCIWHVDQAWRKNLKLIKDREKQVEVYKELWFILQETDTLAFKRMLEEFVLQLQHSGELEFAEYFIKHYYNQCEKWAYCYRTGLGINTNMSMERLHRTIKYNYLDGKKIKRLDKTIHALQKFINDKQFERVIYLLKGKVSSKQAILRNRHNISTAMKNEIFEEKGVWLVNSSTDVCDFYSVSENLKCRSDCPLICKLCNKCFHNYQCSCIDNSIRGNMCKHVHLVCMHIEKIKSDSENNAEVLNYNEPMDLIIDEKKPDDELEWHINDLKSKNKGNNYFQQKKQELLSALDACSQMSSKKQQHAIKIVQEATIKLKALDNNESFIGDNMKSTSKEPANKNIEPQFRFKSTKKQAQKRKLALTKPSTEDHIKLTNKLLMKSDHDTY